MKTLVLASSALTKKCASALENLGFEPIMMPPYERLQEGVSSHPDMLVFFMGNKYICTKEYYFLAKDVFEKINSLGYSPILTDETPKKDYPNDILFNALSLSNKIFGLKSGISNMIASLASEAGFEIINTRQGYAKCSVCKVSENAIITADTGISSLAASNGIDVLTVSPANVRLDGYDYGFIGGASGLFEDKIYFCGDVTKHPDGEKIYNFCKKHKKACISLSDEPLFDVGTLFFLPKV